MQQMLEELMAVHSKTSKGWDNQGPVGLETYVVDADGVELFVTDSGDVLEDNANAQFAALAHQYVPRFADSAMKSWRVIEDIIQAFDRGVSGDGPEASICIPKCILDDLLGRCREAATVASLNTCNYEFRVTLPGADEATRKLLGENVFFSRLAATNAALAAMAGTNVFEAKIHRAILDDDGHVVRTENSHILRNPTYQVTHA